MANQRKLPPNTADHQAALSRIAAKGRSRLKTEGMTDEEIDAAVNELVGKLSLKHTKPSRGR